jgi:hypothetical protein
MRPVRSHPLFLVPALVATMTCAGLAGCTGTATPSAAHPATPSAAHPATPSAAHPAAPSASLPPASPRPAARPGSPGNPLLLSCGEESFTEPPVPQQPRPADLAIGPLFIVNGKRLATASPAGYGDHGSYKIPIIVTMGSTVTVTIAAPAGGQVMIDNPYAHLAGVRDLAAATYRSCSHSAGFLAQGFAFSHGQTRGCVPLDVRIGHQRQVRHVMLSLFAGFCLS